MKSEDHDCLYRYASTYNGFGRHLVPYCIRSPKSLKVDGFVCAGTNHTFFELNSANVTAMELYKLNAPIDLITDYAQYLETGDNGEQIFCNCSHARLFGTLCQYSFVLDSESLSKVVETTFVYKYVKPPYRIYPVRMLPDDAITCYDMFNCTTYVDLCLDWRQICDGIQDCTNKRDEENCFLMELSECDTLTEYRCRNGMCVPKSFSFDLTMDCMDFYDEQETQDTSRVCSVQNSIDCEDHSCGLAGFSCGDGSCFQDYSFGFTGSSAYEECDSQRNSLYIKHIFAFKENTSIDDYCWLHMYCLLGLSCLFEPADIESSCHEGVFGVASFCKIEKDIHLNCPEKFFFPPTHFVLPFVQLLYNRQAYMDQSLGYFSKPSAVCYNSSLCDLSSIQGWSTHKLPNFHGYDCLGLGFFDLNMLNIKRVGITQATLLAVAVHNVFSHCTAQPDLPKTLHKCKNRLLISPERLNDRHVDCFPWSDEYKSEITCQLNLTDRYTCQQDFVRHCVPRRLLRDGKADCEGYADELFLSSCTNEFDCQYIREFDLRTGVSIKYEELCNGYMNVDMSTMTNETDETNCHEWPCNGRAIHCNGVWNRPNGCDEVDCPQSIPYFITRYVANCSTNEHYCLHYNSSNITCLPLIKANDGIIDCLFASDERTTMEMKAYSFLSNKMHEFTKARCYNQSKQLIYVNQICNRKSDCFLGDDELLCSWHMNSSCSNNEFTCKNGTCLPRDVRCNKKIDCPEAEDEWTCDFENLYYGEIYQPFSIEGFTASRDDVRSISRASVNSDITFNDIFSCHRGITAYDIVGGLQCFCPPSYYGARCEYQSERLTISFDMEMLMTFNRQTIYQLVFYLLDGHENSLTVETLVYAPTIYSSKKHVIALIYPRRNQSVTSFGNLSVHIDAYIVTSSTIDFSLSWRYPVQFSFLPVNRLAVRLLIEERRVNRTLCARLSCKYGICQAFVNIDRHFCRCFPDWTGSACDQWSPPLNCSTTSKSVVSHGHAFCLCPLGRTGIECRVPYNVCLAVHCQNGGTCVSLDARIEEHMCVCKENYFGDKCQYADARLLLRIPQTTDFIPVLNIHFLHSPINLSGVLVHRNIFFFKNVHPNSQLMIHEYNQQYLPMFLFAQFIYEPNSYYGSYFLLALIANKRTNLTTTIVDTNRCLHVSERLNATIMHFEWLKRVKFYHQYFKNVKCFYDENYMCLVDNQQLPDCLHFNHGLSNCTNRNYCENGGRCLQHRRSGQLNFACVCPECVAGSFCQLKMTQFSLTLDSILGETIITDVPWFQQPLLIKILVALVVLMFIIGIVSNLMSCVTFFDKNIRLFGCGNYLLILSFVCQLTLIVFLLRFIYLLISQMTIIENKRLLTIGCTYFDFVLALLVSLCDWLTACVAFERTTSTIKGVKFDRIKSVRAVKFVFPLLVIVLVLTSLHQIFNRTLVSDPRNEERLWCVVKFRHAWLEPYTIVLNLFNTIVPFLANLISAIILLMSFTRTKQRTNMKESYMHILKHQIIQHKDLIISPILMIAFKFPLIIVTFVIKCTNSKWQLYLTIIVYFLSLVPLMATFVVFVIPAPSYVKVFMDKLSKFRKAKNIKSFH